MTTPDTQPSADAPDAQQQSVDPVFIEDVKAFLKGDKKPVHEQSGSIVDSLKIALTEQRTIADHLTKLEQEARESQGKAQQLVGKIDALVSVLHGLETHAEDKAPA